MNPRDRIGQGPTVRVYRGSLPLWLLLLVAPLGLVLLASLTIALVLAGAAAAFVLRLLLKRPAKTRNADLIVLDPSDYHAVDRSDR
jgi:hypothetical protein